MPFWRRLFFHASLGSAFWSWLIHLHGRFRSSRSRNGWYNGFWRWYVHRRCRSSLGGFIYSVSVRGLLRNDDECTQIVIIWPGFTFALLMLVWYWALSILSRAVSISSTDPWTCSKVNQASQSASGQSSCLVWTSRNTWRASSNLWCFLHH